MCITSLLRALPISVYCLLAGCTTLSEASKDDIDLPYAADSTIEARELQTTAIAANTNQLADSLGSTNKSTDDNEYKEPTRTGARTERSLKEREEAFNPYVLTAHKHNFILPISYTSDINEDVYRENDFPLGDGLSSTEVNFQISLKSQLNGAKLLFDDDELSLGVTIESWGQLYNTDLSSPVRETNYSPEIFYQVPLEWTPYGGNTALVVGFEHQSNGQVQGLSRSWNRIYTTLIYQRGQFVASLRPWYRIPERAKASPDEARGDDNPDILDFMGHGELSVSWRKSNKEYSISGRGNTSTGNGAITVGMTFPFVAKFRGFVQFFSGYGDSLIDFDHFQQRIGIGVALTNLY